ncbi:MAG: hypothetical protein QGG48_10630, partial [Desulfatiglandales bacterium]|nr:hypothetical protein [Desulfatiglandales bacterium]
SFHERLGVQALVWGAIFQLPCGSVVERQVIECSVWDWNIVCHNGWFFSPKRKKERLIHLAW